MNAEAYIQKDLKCIDPNYFAVFNYKNKRWEIRKWLTQYPRRGGRAYWLDNSKLIFIVRQEDEDGYDCGYEPLDMRVISALQKSHWFKLRWKKELARIDRNNERLTEQADREMELQSRDMARAIYKYYREPSVFLGG